MQCLLEESEHNNIKKALNATTTTKALNATTSEKHWTQQQNKHWTQQQQKRWVTSPLISFFFCGKIKPNFHHLKMDLHLAVGLPAGRGCNSREWGWGVKVYCPADPISNSGWGVCLARATDCCWCVQTSAGERCGLAQCLGYFSLAQVACVLHLKVRC